MAPLPSNCDHCGKQRPIMMVMKPGADGAPWVLCSRCYLDGLRPMDYGVEKPPPKEPVEVSPEMAEALVKSGWKVAPADPKPKKRKTGYI